MDDEDRETWWDHPIALKVFDCTTAVLTVCVLLWLWYRFTNVP